LRAALSKGLDFSRLMGSACAFFALSWSFAVSSSALFKSALTSSGNSTPGGNAGKPGIAGAAAGCFAVFGSSALAFVLEGACAVAPSGPTTSASHNVKRTTATAVNDLDAGFVI
jgi:hypothetical protein